MGTLKDDNVEAGPPLQAVSSTKEGLSLPDHDATLRTTTKRGLTPRHLQLMTIAGGIGVGLFVGIGSTLRLAGPIALILGYVLYGLVFMWPISLNTAEMVAWLPIRGSIYELASRFVDPALGFAMGWNYFLAGAMIVCTEMAAVATLVQYWTTAINPAAWVAVALAVCVFLNMVAVRWYGETEFAMSCTKVLLLFGLLLLTFVTMVGGNPRHDAYGFYNWTGAGNAMHAYYAAGAAGRFLSVYIAVRYAIFTVGGPDFVALSAGEMQNPRRTVPRVAKMILARIVAFYILGVTALGLLCPSRDPLLVQAIEEARVGSAASPWVIGMLRVGITRGLPDLINAVMLLSGLSCGNAYLYSASRTLYSLAQDAHAPAVLLRCTRAGVPWVCVAVVSVIGCLTFLVASNNSLVVFNWFVSLTSACLVIHFTASCWVFIGWRRALRAQRIPLVGVNTVARRRYGGGWGGCWGPRIGPSPVVPAPTSTATADLDHGGGDDGDDNDDSASHSSGHRPPIIFPYIAPFGSWTPWMCLVLGALMTLALGFDVFAPWSTEGFITSYFGLAWFWAAFALWKVVKRSRFVDPATADIFAGGRKQAIDQECLRWEEGGVEKERERQAAKGVFERPWDRFWGQ